MKKEVSIFGKIGFSAFIGGEKLLYVLVSAYATIFYISKLHLNPMFVIGLIFLTRMFDAINDPVVGALIDKSPRKLKSYIKIATVFLPLFTIFMFNVPSMNSFLVYVYVIATYVIWSVLYTVAEVSIYSVVMRMTKCKAEQNYILSISQVGSMMGVFIGLFIIAFYLREGVDSIDWAGFSFSYAILGFALMVLALIFVKEKHTYENESKEEQKLGVMLKGTLTNKHLMTIMVIYMAQMFINASNVLGVYVFDGYFHHPSAGSIIAMFSMALIIPIAISMGYLVKKFGKTNLMYVACFLMIVSNLVAIVIPNLSMTLVVMLMLSQIGIIIPSILRPLYAQECINYEYKQKGYVNESSYFSVMTFFNKAGDALGATLGTMLLYVSGYNELAKMSEQSMYTLHFMHIIYFVGPILMGLSWVIGIRYFYKLSNPKKISLEQQAPIAEVG